MQVLNAYQQTYALKAAIELDVFTHIGGGATTVDAIARQAGASTRGVRILCDYMVIIGFLDKSGDSYALAPDAAVFLDTRSPAYLGSGAQFLASDDMLAHFRDMTAIVRRGGAPGGGTLDPDDPIWVEFARSMGPMVAPQAQALARLIAASSRPESILDVAAGHGLFGIFIAARIPAARVVAVDWAGVLEVARENAERFGVADRYTTNPGSAFDVPLGHGYDLVLLPNFLHHFDPPTNVQLLTRLRAAIRPGGTVATVEFVPNDDRVSPPIAAAFALTMLGSTPAGDAYTFAELDRMFRDAGFSRSRIQPLEGTPHQVVLTT